MKKDKRQKRTCYAYAVFRVLLILICATAAWAQQAGQQGAPPVQVNVLNVCAPPETDQKEIAAALARIPVKPAFTADVEIARGRTSMPDAPLSRWVRIRREFPAQLIFSTVQYTFNVDESGVIETLVFRARDAKQGEALQLSLSDTVTAGAPEAVLASNTPAARIKIERYGKSSLGLSRCPSADQSAYEPVFRRASEVLAQYRAALRVRQVVPADLARVPAEQPQARAASPAAKAPVKPGQRTK